MIENTEQAPVKIKGLGDSLYVTINSGEPLNLLKDELSKSFERLQHLSHNAKIVMDTGDEEGHEFVFNSLATFLQEKYTLASVTPANKTATQTLPHEQSRIREKLEEKTRLRDAERGWEFRKSEVLMIAGRVRAGQRVNAKKHLVVLGDVNPGAEITAGGDILVMGSLCGTAAAGLPGNESAIILALDFRPTQIQIAGLVAAGIKGSSRKIAEFAHAESGGLVVEPYLGNNPFAKMPWPEVR